MTGHDAKTMIQLMQRGLLAFLLSLAAVLWGLTPATADEAGFPRTILDGTGREIVLTEKPTRIFSTNLATDNILLTLVDPDRVVGITRFAADASGSYVVDKIKPHMVAIDALNAELVLSARPDLVLVASWNDPDSVRHLKDLGLTVYTFTHFDSVQDGLDNIERLGELTGEEEKAAQIIQRFQQEVGEIAEAVRDRPRPTVLSWNLWGSTTGIGTATHDIIEMAGGTNLAAVHGIEGWKDINREMIIAMNPDVIITESDEQFVRTILSDPALQTVGAVKMGRVYAIDHTEALNEHVILAIRQLAQYLHPEAFQR